MTNPLLYPRLNLYPSPSLFPGQQPGPVVSPEPPSREIFLRDDFSDVQFENYDAIPQNQRGQIYHQRHIDIRTFDQSSIRMTTRMLDLDQKTNLALDSLTMDDMEGLTIVEQGEGWSLGSVLKQGDRNNWWGISLACTAGEVTSTESILRD